MKPRVMFTAVVLTVLLALPQLVGAAAVHTFDCKNCHIPTLSVTDLGGGNVCLTCHSGELSTLLNDGTTGTTDSAFGGLDSSNAMGNNSSVVANRGQTSHNWTGPDTQTAAGAVAPSRTTHPEFYSRQGASVGRVTCSRCHNPHADDTNPQLLVKGVGSTETMCTACHVPWVQGAGMTNITHPVGIDYATAAAKPENAGKYVAAASLPVNDGIISTDTPISLTGGKINCGTCHQVHFADADPTTPDIPSNWDNLSFNGGNGKVLRTYGRVAPENSTPSAIYNSAVLSSDLCTTCHIFETHGGTHATLGCLDCHGGHSPAGNYNMLRPVVTSLNWVPKDSAPGDSDPLVYTTTTAEWKNASGTGYCQGCHTIPLTVTQHNVASADAADCIGCHSHSTGSFTKTCNGCHGYAPTTNTAGGTTGYAVTTTAPIYNYLTANGGTVFKDETQTPHKRHTAGGSDYSFSCNQCHYTVTAVETIPHKDGNFQDVGFTDAGIIAKTDGAAPAYTTTGNGSCATTYCHSNGGPRSNGAIKYAATAPVWATGAGDITTCNACHGNSVATMAAGDRNNSATHGVHLSKTYSCNVCHSNTASSNTALKPAAIGTDHVDGLADVLFDETYDLNGAAAGGALGNAGNSYGSTDGSCIVYCHSNGKGAVKQAPDWDDATTGDCGDCHAVAAGNGLLGAHDKHLNAGLSCDICHGTNATAGTHATHIDRVIDKPAMAVCNACHGATAAQTTGNDREPIWTSPASVDCGTCHVGVLAQIDSDGTGPLLLRTAPAKNSFFTLGHGDPTLAPSSPECVGCHTLTVDHIDGVTDSNMLTGGATANDAYCQTCHTSPAVKSHYPTTGASATGNACAICHEPHGDGMPSLGNTDAMLIVGRNFTDRTARASYWEGDNSGVCQTCHEAAQVNYYNRTADPATAETNHNPGQVCTNCHKHDTTPAFKAGCTDCHGNTANGNYWPDSDGYGAENGTAWPNRLGSHDYHVTKIAKVKYATATPNVAQKNGTCDYCHPGGGHSGDQLAAPADLGGFKNILGVANVQTASVVQDGGTNVSCSNVDCHYTTTMPQTDWYSGAKDTLANCSYCHVYTGTYTQGTLPNAHNKHMGETADGGRNMECTECHLHPGIDGAHQNGVIDFSTAVAPLDTVSIDTATTAGTKLGPKYGAAGAVAAEFSTCATLYCHGDRAGGNAANTPNWFNTDAEKGAGLGDGACGTCHGTDSAATPISNQHTVHLGSNTYVPNNCDNCHTKNVTTHVYGTVTLGGLSNVTTAPDCTNDCHLRNGADNTNGTGDDALWTAANGLGCEDCHGSGKSADKGWPPAGDAHAKHVAETDYVNDANCTDCHGDNTVTHSVLNGTPVVGGNNITTFNADGTCANKCHTGGDFDTPAALACTNCHTAGTYIGSGGNMPASGLHNATTAQNHGASIGGTGCTECHSATPTSGHLNATLQNSGATTYSWGAKITSYAAADGCAATCHADNAALIADAGKWSRRWAGAVDAKPLATDDPGAAVCDNCHGDGITAGTSTVDNVWRTGLIPAHQDSPDGDATIEMLGQHSNCKTCHGYGDASYNKTWGVIHGDGKIRLNGPAGTGSGYDETQHGCTAACHTGSLANGSGSANENHTLADSGWTIDFGNYGSGDCATCHAAAGRDHSGATESTFTHDLHTGSDYVSSDCTKCHPHDGISQSPGTGVHAVGDNTVNFANLIPNTYNYTGASFGGGCATNTCHDTDGTTEWNAVSLGADSCADCHDSGKAGIFTTPLLTGSAPPTSGSHNLHMVNKMIAAGGALGTQCGACHGAGYGALNSTAPYTNHINTTVEKAGQLSAYDGGTSSCTNTCHTLVGSAGSATWGGANQLGCDDCHNLAANALNAPIHAGMSATSDPGTGKHSVHTGADADYVANRCQACHGHRGERGNSTTLGHVDGSNPTFTAAITSYAAGTCTNTCHNVDSSADDGWINDARTLECTDCHTTAKSLGAPGSATMSGTVAPNTGRHTVHMGSTNYVDGCIDCHGHSGALNRGFNGHVNGPSNTVITMAGQISSNPLPADDTCTNTCHAVVDGRDWTVGAVTNGTALACADCHAATGKSLDQGAWPPTSAAHPGHMGSNALPGAAQNDCYACHGNTTTSAGALTGTGHLNLNAGDVSFNAAFNYEAGTAAVAAGSDGTTTCSAVECHNGVTTPQWGAGTINCGQCHNTAGTSPIPSDAGTAGSHSYHAAGITDCVKCHPNANGYSASGGHADHQNLTVNLTLPTGTYGEIGGGGGINYSGDGIDNGTCATVNCHSNNTTPPWGSAQSAYPARCTICHNDGDGGSTLADAVPSATTDSRDVHRKHVVNADATYVDDCASCHGAGANTATHTGHGNLTVNYATGLTYAAQTCTNACHLAGATDWATAGTLACDDCHNAAGKTLYVSGALTATTPPATGKHGQHDASILTQLAVGCTACHPHSGALGTPATTKHVDGGTTGLATNVDLDGTNITSPLETTAAWTSTCTNVCHSASVADDDWATGTLECIDCHSGSYIGKDHTVNGAHNVHNDTFSASYTTASANNSTAGSYDYNCANCHGSTAANHMNNAVNVAAAVGLNGSKQCATSTCHSNGRATPTYRTSPAWTGTFAGDKCAGCHDNQPSTNAHGVHAVGIHYTDLYDHDGSGLMAQANATGGAAHGVAGTSTTISCNTCHNTVMNTAANDQNTLCTGCHTATPKGNAAISNKGLHVNGARNVAFADLTTFKSKAQVRDSITAVAELNTSWSRNAYKAADGSSFDSGKGAPGWDGASCSTVACHNSRAATWTDSNVNCTYCHTSLPR